jgi:hypothetical protein
MNGLDPAEYIRSVLEPCGGISEADEGTKWVELSFDSVELVLCRTVFSVCHLLEENPTETWKYIE